MKVSLPNILEAKDLIKSLVLKKVAICYVCSQHNGVVVILSADHVRYDESPYFDQILEDYSGSPFHIILAVKSNDEVTFSHLKIGSSGFVWEDPLSSAFDQVSEHAKRELLKEAS